jgi:hypothetical protein
MSLHTLTKTVITMGDGDLLTGMAVHDNAVGSFIFMRVAEPKAPGTPAPEFDGKFGVEDADVVIMFADLACVDRVIADLTLLRDKMVKAGAV